MLLVVHDRERLAETHPTAFAVPNQICSPGTDSRGLVQGLVNRTWIWESRSTVDVSGRVFIPKIGRE